MQAYSLKELDKICKENGFKFACLEDAYGERLITFNGANSDVTKRMAEIKRRLENDITPSGIYYVLFANNIREKAKPQKFAYAKGDVSKQNTNGQNVIQLVKSEQVLSWDSALKYMQEIQELKSANAQLLTTNGYLQQRIDELEADLEELDKGSALEDGNQNGLLTFLKDSAPTLVSALDRYFDLEEKKLNVQSNKPIIQQGAQQNTRKLMKIGSQEHLDLIEKLYKEQNEVALNVQLDKLEAANPDLYKQVCQTLNISENDEE